MPFEITGFEDVLKRIQNLEVGVRDSERSAILVGARIIQAEISRLAPYDPSSNDEHLRDHIEISGFLLDDDGSLYVLVGPSSEDDNMYFYGKFFEWGTSKMRARPFVEPALISKRQEALSAIAQEIRRRISGV